MEAAGHFPVSAGAETSVSIWTAEDVDGLSADQQRDFRLAVNTFGVLSGRAQGLPSPVTDYARLRAGTHVLYLACRREPGCPNVKVLGGLKTGRKQLFIYHQAVYHQMEPVCVLDFYVHESMQRQGVGLQLFQAFLEHEDQVPPGLAYDRPSPKFLAFLAKFFGLCNYVPQNNKYVVFDDYWAQEQSRLARPSSAAPCLSRGKRQSSSEEQLAPNFTSLTLGSGPTSKLKSPLPPMPSQPRARPGAGGGPASAAAAAAAKLGSRPHSTPAQWQIPAAESQQEQRDAQAPAPGGSGARSRSASGELQAGSSQWGPVRPPWALHMPPKQGLPSGAARRTG